MKTLTMFDSSVNKDFMYMLFVKRIDVLMGTPDIHNWFEMNDKEKESWRKFADNFDWGEEDPDWME